MPDWYAPGCKVVCLRGQTCFDLVEGREYEVKKVVETYRTENGTVRARPDVFLQLKELPSADFYASNFRPVDQTNGIFKPL